MGITTLCTSKKLTWIINYQIGLITAKGVFFSKGILIMVEERQKTTTKTFWIQSANWSSSKTMKNTCCLIQQELQSCGYLAYKYICRSKILVFLTVLSELGTSDFGLLKASRSYQVIAVINNKANKENLHFQEKCALINLTFNSGAENADMQDSSQVSLSLRHWDDLFRGRSRSSLSAEHVRTQVV